MNNPNTNTKLQKITQRDRSALFLVSVDGVVVGMISKPRDTRASKSAWLAHKGTGFEAQAVGSSFNKDEAVAMVVK